MRLTATEASPTNKAAARTRGQYLLANCWGLWGRIFVLDLRYHDPYFQLTELSLADMSAGSQAKHEVR